MALFKVGDIVRLKSGRAPQTIIKINKTYRRCTTEYLFTNTRQTYIHVDTLVLFTDYEYLYKRWHTEKHCNIRARSWSFEIRKWLTVYEEDNKLTTSSQEENESMACERGTLFRTKGKKQRYGTFLTTDGEGNYVLEMKEKDGGVEAFPVKDLVEVVPYTMVTTNMSGSNDSHYEVPEGVFKKGELLINPAGNMRVVKDVNTKRKGCSPLNPTGWRRVPTEELKF